MTLIGTLGQFNLVDLLQRIESYTKTGLLLVQQGANRVELYFRDGRLMCIGPVRAGTTLGERLLHDGVITLSGLQDVMRAIGNEHPGETRIALTLMDMGLVSHEDFRTWAAKKAIEVLQVLLVWSSGEVHFEEGLAPAPDRLLVALSISQLLDSVQPAISAPVPPVPPVQPPPQRTSPVSPLYTQPLQAPPPSTPRYTEPMQPKLTRASEFPNAPTLTGAESFHGSAASMAGISASPTAEALYAFLQEPASVFTPPPIQQPEPAPAPIMAPVRIDTSFMQPEMILLPFDLSAGREQNPVLSLTPEQWRLLTRVDGQSSLLIACQELGMMPAQVCQVAGELCALGLIELVLPDALPLHELSPLSRETGSGQMSNGYSAPGFAGSGVLPRAQGVADSMKLQASSSFETQSQWGNGGNGATFIPGQGWIAVPQPLQPLPSHGPMGPYSTHSGPPSVAPVSGGGY